MIEVKITITKRKTMIEVKEILPISTENYTLLEYECPFCHAIQSTGCTIYMENWGLADATAICQQCGFKSQFTEKSLSYFGDRLRKIEY